MILRHAEGFTTDGCTWFPETWREIDLSGCCTAHDLAWWHRPDDWLVFASSNLDLGICFVQAGAWELALPAVIAVSTIGALLFARVITSREAGR